jgi:hypothetical protein
MQRHVATLTAVAVVLNLFLAGGFARSEPRGDSQAGQAVEDSRSAAAAQADTGRGDRGDERRGSEAEAEGEAEGTPPSEAEEPDAEGAEEVGGVAPSGLVVLRAYICKGIDESEPTEAGKSFIPAPDGVLRLCCFSEVGGAARPDTVFHVWYWGDREMARVPLRVQGARWRTWSAKRIVDEWRGDWRVDIIDRDGFVLKRLMFSVE